VSGHVETRAVLAGAYRGPDVSRRQLLTHAVAVDETGRELAVLCNRVGLDSLADRQASDPSAPPTCPSCVRRLGGSR
jgi:hypothetical protein